MANYSCVYISDSAYKELLDFNNVNRDTFYVVHYEDILPGVNEPIIDVFLGKHRLSAIINLDTVPSIDIAEYINIDVLKDNLKEISSTIATVDTKKIEETIDELIDTLAKDDIINNQISIPTNIGQSNKLYLYFDKVARKYQMYIFHPVLHKFIPLKLDPISISVSGGGGGHGGTTIIEQHLHIDNAIIVTAQQLNTLDVSGERIDFDLSIMGTAMYGNPDSNVIVQGLICNSFLNTSSEQLYSNFTLQAYYGRTMFNFNIVSYLAEYGYLINDTFKLSDNKIYRKYMYKFFDANSSSETPQPIISLDGYISSAYTGISGIAINVKQINSPDVDPQLFPYGYVDADLMVVGYNGSAFMPSINSENNFNTFLSSNVTDLFDLVNENHYVVKTDYNSLVSSVTFKIPFASLAEYRYSMGLISVSEITEVNS